MSAVDVAAVRARLSFRIHGLVNRGADVCAEYITPPEADICCARCGYRDDVHTLRDTLAALDQQQREIAAADERLLAAEQRVYGDGLTFGCDAADHLAESILSLRADLAAAQAAIERLEESAETWAQQCIDVRAERDALKAALAQAEERASDLLRQVDTADQLLYRAEQAEQERDKARSYWQQIGGTK